MGTAHENRPSAAFAKAAKPDGFAEETSEVGLDGKIQVGKGLYQLPKGWERTKVRIYRLADRLNVIGGKENMHLADWSE